MKIATTKKMGLMYRSKKQVESKLAQARYVLKEMQKYCGKVFVNNGIDPETGAYPLQVNISSFLAHTRSVLQCAHKESKARNKTSVYDSAVNKRPIIALFRELRNTDIHDMVIGTHTIIYCDVQFCMAGTEAKKHSETNPKEARIVNRLSKPVAITDALIERLRNDGRTDLADAADSGKPLYETVEFEGEEDIYVLCENYIDNLNDFVMELLRNGAIS